MSVATSSAVHTSENPIAIDGIEFVEYATRNPEQFGQFLKQLGFAEIARHRSREVFLYRQNGINLIVNGDIDTVSGLALAPRDVVLSGVALRVADAGYAHKTLVKQGAWPIQTQAGTMELNIPGVHGVGDSIIYLVDRYHDFSIYDVDFKYLETAPSTAEIPGIHCFGLAQYVGSDRLGDWVDFYGQLFGFSVLPFGQSFGILPRGVLLESPCKKFYLQLIPPLDGADVDVQWDESFARLAFGVPDVMAAVSRLKQQGVEFEERELIHVTDKGALTRDGFGGMNFEFVASRGAGGALG